MSAVCFPAGCRFSLLWCCFLVLVAKVRPLDNGLALTPPMGWMAWERFRCNIDCNDYPDECVSEKLFRQMAEHIVNDGFLSAGYEYICIDDCWMARSRSKTGDLQADPVRFPSGIKALADYIHSKGLKFGLYADYGSRTCAGYPGSINHIEQDMKTFAKWGVDYLKLDGCYTDPKLMDTGYPRVSKVLNATGRKIMYSCSWPAYLVWGRMKPNYKWIAKNCNTWRNFNDVEDDWHSVVRIIDYYGDHQDELVPVAGPGHWNDPDQLMVGNFGLSYEQARAQFALWAVMASPLMMSNDLRNIASWAKEILLNSEIIGVSQDRLGKQGRRYKNISPKRTETWVRPLSDGSAAVVLFSQRTDRPVWVKVTFKAVGLPFSFVKVRDLFEHQDLGVFNESFRAKVNPTGVVLVRLVPIQDKKWEFKQRDLDII